MTRCIASFCVFTFLMFLLFCYPFFTKGMGSNTKSLFYFLNGSWLISLLLLMFIANRAKVDGCDENGDNDEGN